MGRIFVTNPASTPAFLNEGQIIEGLRQSRMVTFDLLIQPRTSASLQVVCVEEKRWGEEQEGSLAYRAPISVIAALRQRPLLQTEDARNFSQRNVWSSVSRHQSRTNSLHTTSLSHMVDTYHSSSSYLPLIQSASKQLQDDHCGMVVSALGEPLLVETFGDSFIFAQHFESIIQSVFWDLNHFESLPSSKETTRNFFRDVTSISVSSTEEDFFKIVGNLSLKVFHKSNELEAIHSLAINHEHPIFV